MITADGDRTPSQKLVRANIACGDEVDPAGNMTAKLREWK
jgi:hypothetical protein